ncbi:MAG: DHH family phosphoesterase [Bacilli bacterium]
MREIAEKIKQYDTIIIHRHVRPDPDAYGSSGGLAQAIRDAFPEKRVYQVGRDEPSLAYLGMMDDISDETYDGALVIVCDTANQARVDDQRFTRGEFLIKIDHHPNNDPYGDLVWVDTDASSCSEMIYEFITTHADGVLTLSGETSRLLYAGIVGDTGRFLFPNTKPSTFNAAQHLISYGFSFANVYTEMYRVTEATARLRGYVYQTFETPHSGVGIVKLSQETLEQFGVKASETSSITGLLGDVDGIEVWVVFIEEEPGQIRCRFRSKRYVINDIAAMFNGGGHPLSSGGSIDNWDQVSDVIAALHKRVEEQQSK